MKGVIIDYGATLDSNGKHWSEIIWEGYCLCSLPVTKDLFRDAYIYTERFLAFNPAVKPEYNFFELMQARVGIQLTYLLQSGALSEEILQTTLRLFSDGEMPIMENISDLTTHFSSVIAGHCYDYARRCTMEAAPIIEHFSEKYEIALVSNFYGNLKAVLQDFGLLRCFRHVIDSAEVGIRKPDPEIFKLAIEQLQLPPEEIYVIGDNFRKDIEPALGLGCKGIWIKGVSWNDKDNERVYEPSVTSLLQLYDIL
ncbi:MAG: HAD family hydrolase [Bacteroidales bacterium]|nr:HAD family hydrolase [Bacteroidales bacterium]